MSIFGKIPIQGDTTSIEYKYRVILRELRRYILQKVCVGKLRKVGTMGMM